MLRHKIRNIGKIRGKMLRRGRKAYPGKKRFGKVVERRIEL